MEARKLVSRVLEEKRLLEGGDRNTKAAYSFAPYDIYTGNHFSVPIAMVTIERSDGQFGMGYIFPSEKVRQQVISKRLFSPPSQRAS